MKKQIIYISHLQFSKKLAEHWFFNDFMERAIECFYLDVGPIVRVNYIRNKETMDREFVFNSFQEFIELISNHNQESTIYIILFLPNNFTSMRLYRILKKFNCKTLFFSWGAYPFAKFHSPKRNRIDVVLKNLFSRVITRLTLEFFKKTGQIAPIDYLFTAGSVLGNTRIFNRNSLAVNLCDNDTFLKVSKTECKKVNYRYAVFLDSNMVNHLDAPEGAYIMDASVYFSKMRAAFDQIEKTGIQVVVASHPTSDYTEQTFGGRSVFRGITAELVKYSELVIAHQSTSISYAILFEKPLLLIKTDEMEFHVLDSPLDVMLGSANALQIPIMRAEDIVINDVSNIKVNKSLYDNYKYKYLISHGVEKASNFEIVYPLVKKLLHIEDNKAVVSV